MKMPSLADIRIKTYDLIRPGDAIRICSYVRLVRGNSPAYVPDLKKGTFRR